MEPDKRIFSEKELSALAVAFHAFLRELDSKTRRVSTVRIGLESALDYGLTIDQLFNPYNWKRTTEIFLNATANDYVDCLVNRRICINSLSDEELTEEDLSLLSTAYHTFYQFFRSKGGAYTTKHASKRLKKVLEKFSFQNLLSEANIEHLTGEDSSCTDYLIAVSKQQELPGELTQEQTLRADEDAMLEETPEPMSTTTEEENTSVSDEALEEKLSQFDNEDTEKDLKLLAVSGQTDPTSDVASDPVKDWLTNIEELKQIDDEDVPDYISFTDPQEYKKEALKNIIFKYTIDELKKVFELTPNTGILNELIDSLVAGNIDKTNMSPECNDIYSYLCGDLIPAFITCAKMQGVEMDEEIATRHDVIAESWEMRSKGDRMICKLRNLVFEHGNDDADLYECINVLDNALHLKGEFDTNN